LITHKITKKKSGIFNFDNIVSGLLNKTEFLKSVGNEKMFFANIYFAFICYKIREKHNNFCKKNILIKIP